MCLLALKDMKWNVGKELCGSKGSNAQWVSAATVWELVFVPRAAGNGFNPACTGTQQWKRGGGEWRRTMFNSMEHSKAAAKGDSSSNRLRQWSCWEIWNGTKIRRTMKNIGQKRTKAPFLLCYEFPVTTFLKTKCIYKLKQRVILHFQHPKVLLNLVFYIKPCYFRDGLL